MKALFIKVLVCGAFIASPALAGPAYDPDRADLEKIMEDLIAWLPGSWDSYPQIYRERTGVVPEEGEHEHWHRVFERIDAPQIGDVVFYGQIQSEGRNSSLLGRSQIIYNAWIDEERGAVIMNGQPTNDDTRFEDLHEKPELWGEVQMRDPDAINCDFLWFRDGQQIMALLEGKTKEKRKYGLGTCTYYAAQAEAQFYADAEWVLGPDTLWIYDINMMDDMLFIGREDKTHTRLERARPYTCEVTDAKETRSLNAHDRGFRTEVTNDRGEELMLLLLRAEYPGSDGFGLDDRLKLILYKEKETITVSSSDADPLAEKVALEAGGIYTSCQLEKDFPLLSEADG